MKFSDAPGRIIWFGVGMVWNSLVQCSKFWCLGLARLVFFLFGGVGLNPLRSLCRSPRSL
jgi:hypothetical protein